MDLSIRTGWLNSKAGYNRSGISRLVLKPQDEASDEQGRASSRMEREEQEGIATLTRRAYERARKVFKRPIDCQDMNPKGRKRKKLNHEILDEDWGLESGELKSETGSVESQLAPTPKMTPTPTPKMTNEVELTETNNVRNSEQKDLMEECGRELNPKYCSARPKPPAIKQKKWGKKKSGLYGWVSFTPDRMKTVEASILKLNPRGVVTQKSKEK